jgi:hypothetical protein
VGKACQSPRMSASQVRGPRPPRIFFQTDPLPANDRARFSEHVAAWPADVRDHAIKLAFGHDDHRHASNPIAHSS